MHQDLINLCDWLDEATTLLQCHQIQHWAEWLSKDAQRIRQGDFYGVQHLRSAFGGMGSLNDFGLAVPHPEIPGRLISSPDDERFQWVLSQIFELTTKLVKEEG